MREAIKQALAGERKLRITFKEQAMVDLNYLFGMENSGIVIVDPSDKVVLDTVLATGDWEFDANRTMTVTLTETFDESWFLDRMERSVESAVGF